MYLGRTKRYNFFSLEIDTCSKEELERIAASCQKVEDEVWNATSNFFEYIRDQSALVYAEYDQKIIGFALFDLFYKRDTLVVAANECMVVKEHHGYNLPNMFMSILVSHIRKDNRKRGFDRNYKSITFISLTVNFKLMQAFKRYSRFLADKSTFKPDKLIEDVATDYIKKEQIHLLEDNNLYFAKAAFPNAVKVKANIKIPDFVPMSFKSENGDAFLFVCRVSRFWLLGLMARLIRVTQGFKFSRKIIPFTRFAIHKPLYVRHPLQAKEFQWE